MKFNTERIQSLQVLLRDIGLDYDNEQSQEAGLAIMRFVLAKHEYNSNLITEEGDTNNE